MIIGEMKINKNSDLVLLSGLEQYAFKILVEVFSKLYFYLDVGSNTVMEIYLLCSLFPLKTIFYLCCEDYFNNHNISLSCCSYNFSSLNSTQ